MSDIFKARENVGITNRSIGDIMFGQIITDIMEEARSGDRILFATSLHEKRVREIMQRKGGEYRLKIERCTRGDFEFKVENYNITTRIISVCMYSDKDIMRKTTGCLFDKVVIADASWVGRNMSAYLSSRCRSNIGEKDREAITIITSNIGWFNSKIIEYANVFVYEERSVR